jgi:hypothetical protein
MAFFDLCAENKLGYNNKPARECLYVEIPEYFRRGPTSFVDLRTVDGRIKDTYEEAAAALGLLERDSERCECLREAAVSSTGRELRALFAVILVNGRLDDARALWDELELHFMDDFRDVSHDLKTALPLRDIDQYLRANGKELGLAAFPTLPQLAVYHELLAR